MRTDSKRAKTVEKRSSDNDRERGGERREIDSEFQDTHKIGG